MVELRTAHTADLDDGTLSAVQALLAEVFEDLQDDDWEHALGGIHALVWDGPALLGHASTSAPWPPPRRAPASTPPAAGSAGRGPSRR